MKSQAQRLFTFFLLGTEAIRKSPIILFSLPAVPFILHSRCSRQARPQGMTLSGARSAGAGRTNSISRGLNMSDLTDRFTELTRRLSELRDFL